MKISRFETIQAVVPENCVGSGWCNQVVWVFLEDRHSGEIRRECLQPGEWEPIFGKAFEPARAMAQFLIQTLEDSRDF